MIKTKKNMTVEYNKGTACPILLRTKESAVALTMDSAKKLQADLAKVIERVEKDTIERAESHLESVLLNFLDVDTVKWIIKDFKKAMEEQK